MNREILQQALNALENSYLSDELRNYELQAKAIAALREALNAPEPEPVARVAEVHMSRYTIEWTSGPLPEGTGLYAAPPAAPEPEPVAWLVEGWHDGKLIAHIPHLTLEDAKASAAVFSQHYTTTKLVPLYAALREALNAPEPEPVAWCELTPNGSIAYFDGKPMVMCGPVGNECHTTPLYAAPPAAPAPAAPVVPLTEGRITAIANELAFGGGHCNVYELARAIEAAHGITGASK